MPPLYVATLARGVAYLQLQLRHPNLLAFKESAETTEKGAIVLYLVTEPVKPLKDVLSELDIEGQHRCVPVGCGELRHQHFTASPLACLPGNEMKLTHCAERCLCSIKPPS